MVMDTINIAKAKEIASKKKLSPGKVKGTEERIQFTKGTNSNIETISWDEFESILSKKGLAIYASSGGFMKIMKKA